MLAGVLHVHSSASFLVLAPAPPPGSVPLPTAVLELAKLVLPVVIAAASGVWAVLRWTGDRREARRLQETLAKERLDQQKLEEDNRRRDRAAAVMLEVGRATDAASRRWYVSALALYPGDTIRLLVNYLGRADDEVGMDIELAMMSMGTPCIPELVRMNAASAAVVGRSGTGGAPAAMDVAGATRILASTQRVIASLLLQTPPDARAGLSLNGADLSAINLSGADLRRCNFAGANLGRSVLSKCNLTGSDFRGATLARAVMTEATADSADWTDSHGRCNFLAMRSRNSRWACNKLAGSIFNGADLVGSSFEDADLSRALMHGADMSSTQVVRGNWANTDLTKAELNAATFENVKLNGAIFDEAVLHGSGFTKCKAPGSKFRRVRGSARFVDMELGGATFEGAHLRDVAFIDCNLGGASFAGAEFSGVRFEGCNLSSTVLRVAAVDGLEFAGRNTCGANPPEGSAIDWNDVKFAIESADVRRALVN